MFLAVPIGLAATAACVRWFARKRLTQSSFNWGGRIVFYDYIECGNESIENVLKVDNGQIIELNILYKDVSGSTQIPLAHYIPQYHLALVFKTDKNEYWSIEKNEKAIYVQKTSKENEVMYKLDGIVRNTPIIHNTFKQNEYLTKWNINYSNPYNIAKKSVLVNNVLVYLIKKEVSIKYSYVENCQHFIERVLNFTFHGIRSSLTIYNYSLNKSLTWHELNHGTNEDLFISDVKWLYKETVGNHLETNPVKTLDFVGFLIQSSDGKYFSFEQDYNCVYIQQSDTEHNLMRLLNGIDRDSVLKRGNEGYEKYVSIRSRKSGIKRILQTFKVERMITNDRHGFIENGLHSVYDPCDRLSTGLTFYDYNEHKSEDIISTALNTEDNVLVYDVSLLSKVSVSKCDMTDATVSNCIVMLIKTSDQHYWSIERNNNFTHVQRSTDQGSLIERLDSVERKKPLEHIRSPEDNKKQIKVRGLLEFVIEFHRKFDSKQCEEIINRTLHYFRYM